MITLLILGALSFYLYKKFGSLFTLPSNIEDTREDNTNGDISLKNNNTSSNPTMSNNNNQINSIKGLINFTAKRIEEKTRD